jgi:hypothetical protein
MRTALILLAALTLAGCSTTRRPSFALTDKDLITRAFIDATRAHYQGRADGVLEGPTTSPNQLEFLFRYTGGLSTRHAEQVTFRLHDQYTDARDQMVWVQCWSLRAWFQEQGADPEAPLVRRAILDDMAKRPGGVQPLN